MLKEALNQRELRGGCHIIVVQNEADVWPTIRRLKSILDDEGISYGQDGGQPRVSLGGGWLEFKAVDTTYLRASRATGVYFDHPLEIDAEKFYALQHVTERILVGQEYV